MLFKTALSSSLVFPILPPCTREASEFVPVQVSAPRYPHAFRCASNPNLFRSTINIIPLTEPELVRMTVVIRRFDSDDYPQRYLIWIGSDQEKTFGPTISGLIEKHLKPDNRVTLWDSRQRGKWCPRSRFARLLMYLQRWSP